MKFDFRRDVSRIGHLKSLPLTPASTVVGQLATPVAVSTIYQLVVVGLACLVLPSQAHTLLIGLALFVPMNVFIFSLENLIFLLYPYRMNQEGLDVFLRTILTFTAKGLLFAFGAGAIVAWAFVGHELIGSLTGTRAIHGALVFTAGLAIALVAVAVVTSYALVRAFVRFDPSLDTPA